MTGRPEPVVTVTTTCGDIIRHLCRTAEGVETGGLLIGDPGAPGVVAYASGPGLRARATPDSLEWDASFVGGMVTMAMVAGVPVLGRWHKHTSHSLAPSVVDVASAEIFRRETGVSELYDLYVSGDDAEAWAAYHVGTSGHTRATVSWRAT